MMEGGWEGEHMSRSPLPVIMHVMLCTDSRGRINSNSSRGHTAQESPLPLHLCQLELELPAPQKSHNRMQGPSVP